MQQHSERDILVELKNGSSDAFEILFHRYVGKLYNFVLKFSSGNTFMTEEIVQSTFVKIWENHSSINPDKSYISYLCTIAKNLLLNEYKHQMVQYVYRDYILKFHSNIHSNEVERDINKKILEEYIDRLIEKMPPVRKQVFILSRKKMLSNKEIAQYLQISENTVQNHLSKALSFMKEHLAKHYDHIILLLLYSIFVN